MARRLVGGRQQRVACPGGSAALTLARESAAVDRADWGTWTVLMVGEPSAEGGGGPCGERPGKALYGEVTRFTVARAAPGVGRRGRYQGQAPACS
jgi:hypothetical protein